MDLRLLVDRIQAGDGSAAEELASELRRRVFVMLLARIGDAESAKELTQDVLMAVLDAIQRGKVEDPDRLGAFVHGVTRNVANNHIRSQALVPPLIELTDEMAWADAEEEIEMADRRRLLTDAIQQLDRLDREVVTLTIVEGCSAPEVAQRVGLTADAVRARKSRALKRLGDLLRSGVSRLRIVPPLSS